MEVKVTQEEDIYRSYGKPSIQDAFGNVMSELSPKVLPASLRIYRLHSTLQLTVNTACLYNLECAVAEVESTAIATWTISKLY